MTDSSIGRGQVIGFTYTFRDVMGEIIEYSDMPITHIHGGGWHKIVPQIETALHTKLLDDLVVPIPSSL